MDPKGIFLNILKAKQKNAIVRSLGEAARYFCLFQKKNDCKIALFFAQCRFCFMPFLTRTGVAKTEMTFIINLFRVGIYRGISKCCFYAPKTQIKMADIVEKRFTSFALHFDTQGMQVQVSNNHVVTNIFISVSYLPGTEVNHFAFIRN